MTPEQARVVLRAADEFDKASIKLTGMIERAHHGLLDRSYDDELVEVIEEFIAKEAELKKAVDTRGVLG